MNQKKTIRIALIQQKNTLDREKNLARGLDALDRAASAGAGLIVFPELSFLPFLPQHPAGPGYREWAETVPGPTTELISRKAAERRVVVIFNLLEIHDGKTYDSSPVIDSDGRLVGVNRMVHVMEAPGFHEKGYYHPGDLGAGVFETAAGRIGVAICYDRHFPEYMRGLALKGAELVVTPQAGAKGEWPAGLFEAELQVAAFQNGYFCALANRVGKEEVVEFDGGSFVVDPSGQVIARAEKEREDILLAEINFGLIDNCPARRHFIPDRRPEVYQKL
ncbi:MAG: N-carbamoylputrescine amidase [Candidatus Saccharicenans subterraneus]|uniref:N-carbamoylputrescine amidase n=1 Tax=Candidatus Saccharicenans subterraneus TaxID=2508984 RepID=A0A3E2BKH3_9BACT|nr:MAG: N-carbamoylputrescine amidase [Candidatus Saccharicenans subterraneum]